MTSVSWQPIPGGRRAVLDLTLAGLVVPSILTLPDHPGRVPAALLLHGYSSRKEVMADTVGRALVRHGVASLAIDLPLHGQRGTPVDLQNVRNPMEAARVWRLALREAELAVEHLGTRPEVDPARLAVVGYSLGSFLSVTLAARLPQVRAVVLAAGGDLPLGSPLTQAARLLVDPTRAVRKFEGRPLLMVNGRHDRTITPEQATRLYDAALDPKEIQWWDVGHTLPDAAIERAAGWLAERLGVPEQAART